MLVTIDWIRENYIKFNKEFFDGALPMVTFKINNSKQHWGFAGYRYNLLFGTVTPTELSISNFYDSPEEVKINTLLHEMIHIADYTFHPEHFVKNGRHVSERYYDSHGAIFFLKEAARINAHGYKISPKVQSWETEMSDVSEKNKNRLNAKIQKGIKILLLRLAPNVENLKQAKYGMYTYVIVNTTLDDWIERFSSIDYYKNHFECADLFISRDPSFANCRSSKTGVSIYCCMPPEEFITKHQMEFQKNIYGENLSLGNNNTTTIEEPKPESKRNTIPEFKWAVNTSSGRKVIQFNNITREELKIKIKQIFPKCSDENIEKILNNKANYPLGESMKITEDDIKTMVKEALGQVLPKQNKPQITRGENGISFIKPINDVEGIAGIE